MTPMIPRIYQGKVFVKEGSGDMGRLAKGGVLFATIPDIRYVSQPTSIDQLGNYETLVVAPLVFTIQKTHFFYTPEDKNTTFESSHIIHHEVGGRPLFGFNLTFFVEGVEPTPEPVPELDPIQEASVNLVGLILERQKKLGKEIDALNDLANCLIAFKP